MKPLARNSSAEPELLPEGGVYGEEKLAVVWSPAGVGHDRHGLKWVALYDAIAAAIPA